MVFPCESLRSSVVRFVYVFRTVSETIQTLESHFCPRTFVNSVLIIGVFYMGYFYNDHFRLQALMYRQLPYEN